MITIEMDVSPKTLGRPRFMDHAWLFATQGIHRRLQDRGEGCGTGVYQEPIVSVEKISAEETQVSIVDGAMWSNGAPITGDHVSRFLSLYGLHENLTIGESRIISRASYEYIDQILSSPWSVLTPDFHDFAPTVVSGMYFPSRIETSLECIEMAPHKAYEDACEAVSLKCIRSAEESIRHFNEGKLQITRTLGMDPKYLSDNIWVYRQELDIFMTLVPNTVKHSTPSELEIDLTLLSDATGGTYTPYGTAAKINFDLESDLLYTDFPPNGAIAAELCRQIDEVTGKRPNCKRIPYSLYRDNAVPPGNLILIVLNQPGHLGREFAPLMRARTTALISNTISGSGLIDNYGCVRWDHLRGEGNV